MKPIRTLAVAMLCLLSTLPARAELPQATQQEIAGMMAHMEQSGCEFQRNGSWHNAADARAHLQKKYDYLRQRNMLSSAEDFIIGAATQSSISGQAYQVRCPGMAAVESAAWFRKVLQQYRKR